MYDYSVRIILIVDCAVGKTSIMQQYHNKKYADIVKM